MHPLRQTSFPNLEAERSFGATSDAGSVTGSFTGSLGGTSADGVFANAARGKKRGRKSKAEKEREREREDALSSRAGDGTRFGSVDAEGSTRGGLGGGGTGGDDLDEDEDDDEGELLGREEGTTDTEAEKKNLAYVALCLCHGGCTDLDMMANGLVLSGFLLMHSTLCSLSDMICSNVQNFAKNRSAVLSIMLSPNLCRPASLLLSMVSLKSSPVK